MLLIFNDNKNPYFNMAAEEYFLDRAGEDVVMLWRNDRTVVIGKNQNTIEEINVRYIEENDISVVRRLSGGGAVFHDLGNVNYTLIQKQREDLFSNYAYFTRPVVDFLQSLGVAAELSGRNDLLIDGLKFCGNAQAARNGKIMHHGCLLFSSEVEDISGSLTPNKKKIESKGVKSVKSRVTNIARHMTKPMDVEDFMKQLYDFFIENAEGIIPYELTVEDIAAIEKLAVEKYATWEWNYGASPKYTFASSEKYDFGLVDVRLLVEKGKIADIRIFGDFFGIKPISELEKRLVGVRHEASDVDAALEGVRLSEYIAGMRQEELAELIMNRT